jgi:hypothetical protein
MYKIANQKELKEILWETWQGETQIMFVFLSWRSSTGKDWGLTRGGTTYVISYTNQDIDRKREGKNQPTRDIKSNCLGLVAFKLTYKLWISPGHKVGSVSNQIFAVGFILY